MCLSRPLQRKVDAGDRHLSKAELSQRRQDLVVQSIAVEPSRVRRLLPRLDSNLEFVEPQGRPARRGGAPSLGPAATPAPLRAAAGRAVSGRPVCGTVSRGGMDLDTSWRTINRRIGASAMARVIVANWVTLDGVMQAPGGTDEDTRDGFTDGGWGAAYTDPVMGSKMGELMTGNYAWLFGRTSYEGLLESWNRQGGPFKDALNNRTKYVASRNQATHLAWPNSTLLHGDVPAAVAELKQDSDTNLVILGSHLLINSLVDADLIDEYLLMIAPIVLGHGRRLFLQGTRTTLRLRELTPTPTGAVIAIYERDR